MAGISAISRANSKQVVSTHGKRLILELSDLDASLETVLNYIDTDPLAGRLKDPDLGNTAYHLLLGSNFPYTFIIPVLRRLLDRSAEGVKVANKIGNLPLHLALAQPNIEKAVAALLIEAYPASVGMPNSQGLTPLFLCVMRDNPSFEICKLVCMHCKGAPR
jgi:hypothetical protein